jgi:hypothetical protein
VKLYEESFREHPSVASQQSSRFRRQATSDALVAGTGGGVDAPADPAARKSLRERAISWFQQEVAECEEKSSAAPSGAEALSNEIEQWMKEATIGRTRPPTTFEGLTPQELEEWRCLWVRFDALRRAPDSRVSR